MANHHHFILHKPFGYLSQFVTHQTKRKNKKLLGELYNFPEGTMAIGRLDEASEGLLLLTTDGKLSDRVRSKKVEKEYYVQVDGEITNEAIEKLKQGVEISINGKKY
ncbi:MAG: pseudouridine synthase, partial [Bacteroidales bacterium]